MVVISRSFLFLCFVVSNASSHASDQDLLIKSLQRQVDVLMHKFDIVTKENDELRSRLNRLEEVAKTKVSSNIQRGRRQLSPFVAFSAYLDHQLTGLKTGAPIIYNRVITNDGSGYDNTTGIFEAPRTGLYLFSWSTTARRLSGQPAYDTWINLVLDGKTLLGTVAESREENDDNQGSNTIVVRMNAGQRVWTVHNSGYSTLHGADNERTTSFTGVLLFEYE